MQQPAGDLDALVGRWMALRSEIAAEKSQAREREAAWTEEIALLEAEKAALLKETAEFDATASGEERKRAEQAAELDRLRTALEEARPALDRAEAGLRAWRKNIPESLLGGADKQFDALPETAAQAAREADGARVQRVVSLLTHIETLQAGIHPAQETLDTGAGARRRVDVVYLGLARGFAVSSDNTWAAVGEPGAAGWTWSARPEAAAEIRSAVEMLRREKTAGFVRLPLRAGAAGAAP